MWFFDRLVWTVLGYGVEIWRWRERERMERKILARGEILKVGHKAGQ